jgi:hypothetical protein
MDFKVAKAMRSHWLRSCNFSFVCGSMGNKIPFIHTFVRVGIEIKIRVMLTSAPGALVKDIKTSNFVLKIVFFLSF